MKLSAEFKNVAKATTIALPLLGATAYTVLNSGVASVMPILFAAYIANKFKPRAPTNSLMTDPNLEAAVDRLAPKMGFRKSPKIYMSKVPFTSPAMATNEGIIVSPEYASILPPAQKDWLLAHEMRHVKRKDGLPTAVYGSSLRASVGLAGIWTLHGVSEGLTHAVTNSFPISYALNSANNAVMAILVTSLYYLTRKSVPNTIAENHEMEFDCDRAASITTGDIDSGVELLSMYKEFRQDLGPFTIIQSNTNWYADSYMHPSSFSRVQALEDLRADPAFQPRPQQPS